MKKNYLSVTDLSADQTWQVFKLAKKLKLEWKEKGKHQQNWLDNKTMAMIFEKPSLRTRLSFETALTQLGGHAIYLGPNDIGMGKRESVGDIAIVTSSMCDLIMARVFKHSTIEQLAKHSSAPVINALSDLEHPCQILADVMTIWEEKDNLQNLTVAFVGDGDNNVTNSLCLASAILGINFKCASPEKYLMSDKVIDQAKLIAKTSGSTISQSTNPIEAVEGSDVVITDTWVSMGDESEKKERLKIFMPYQVNKKLMSVAKPAAIFMHCLPAYRGNEVSSEVIDGPQSVVFLEAENRLHVQKALILYLMGLQ
ncbi:ornithine carbamoyltransferase [Patescibacteria group bacterium]|nr:ornithine carbamoyltransferase [Patescibacteria group bacterium]MBU1966677.1 ornithine carbamoyltransferase [Patescibacteria group bacterium]MBU2543634.1 ornithine carbamoyltransferase [Patescibacteria group bacterium]